MGNFLMEAERRASTRDGVKMIDKDPMTYSVLTYLWVVALSVWGGLVSFLTKVKTGQVHKFSFMHFIGEMVTAGFVGVLTFWLCELADFSQLLTAVMVGISGHMGTKVLNMFEDWAKRRFAP